MRILSALILMICLLAACGYKGPLYLPKTKASGPAAQPAPIAASAPMAQ